MSPSLLDALEPGVRSALLASARRRSFARRETIFHRGDPGDSMMLVDEGRVAIKTVTPRGDVVTLALVGPSELFGEMAVLADAEPRSATAIALEDTTVLSVHRDALDRLRRENPAIDRFLVTALAGHVRRTSQLLVEALYMPAEPRVRRRITELVAAYATEGRSVEIPLTQDEIAQLAGTSRATVNKVLGAAAERGLVVLRRGRVIVPAPARVGVHRDRA